MTTTRPAAQRRLPITQTTAQVILAQHLLDPDGNNIDALYRDVGNVGHGSGPALH